jgi:solute carrier family 25 folate transporter 32
LYQREGIKAFYKGLGTTLLAYVPNWAIYFGSYNYAKTRWSKLIPDGNPMLINLLSSVTAGATCNVITAPLWTIRTRMQTQAGYGQYKNTWDAYRKIKANEGIKALYRGIVPSMFGLIHVGVQFPTYEYLKEKQAGWMHRDIKDLTASQVFFASAASKIIASVIAYPHEVVRSRLQVAGQAMHIQESAAVPFKSYSGVTDALRTIWEQEGLRGFYRGMGTNLLRTVPAAVITLSSYEWSRHIIQKAVP